MGTMSLIIDPNTRKIKMQYYPSALILAIVLALHGLRKGSLSLSGAIAAFSVGYISLACPVKAFGITLLVFYFTGSRATKVGHKIKALLEVESNEIVEKKKKKEDSKHKSAKGGQRDAWQVFCNSFVSAIAALLFRLLYSNPSQWKDGKNWCLFDGTAMSARMTKTIDHDLKEVLESITSKEFVNYVLSPETPRILFLIMLGHFSCCMGDTLASELGILAKRPPRLILPPFRIVPPGTNGGLSVQGTLGSLLGGALIGLTAGISALFLDNSACSAASISILTKTVCLGGLGGILGSGLDSFLGATLQRTWFNTKTKQVLLGRLPSNLSDKKDWRVITGYDILGNNAVNFISSATTSILIAYLGNQFAFE